LSACAQTLHHRPWTTACPLMPLLANAASRLARLKSGTRGRLCQAGAIASMASSRKSNAIPDFGKLKGVLFDIDGTLCDSDPLHLRVFQDMLQREGFNGGQRIDKEFFNSRIAGRHNPEIMADLFPAWSEEQRTAFYMEKERIYRELAAGVLQPVAGLSDFLRWIDERGLKKAAVTNAPGENAAVMIRALGLEGKFDAIVLGEKCTRAKPFPDPYLEAMRLLGIQADEAVAVEDSPSGMAAAVAAGVPTFGVLTGQKAEVLVGAGACATVKDYHELMRLAGIAEEASMAAPPSG